MWCVLEKGQTEMSRVKQLAHLWRDLPDDSHSASSKIADEADECQGGGGVDLVRIDYVHVARKSQDFWHVDRVEGEMGLWSRAWRMINGVLIGGMLTQT